MHFRPFVTAATLTLTATPAPAGGYVVPFPVEPILASAPVAAPAPGFTLCGEPVVCAALALLIFGALVGGRDHDAPPKVVVPPPIVPPLEPEPEPSPVPLPLSGVLLAGGLASLPLLRRRNSADLQFPGTAWPGHDPDMPPGGYGPGTAILG
jgi:hypothetical protein